MSIRNRDIIERMERNGDYSASIDFRDSLREHGHSEYESADRYNPADGAQYSYAGDRAERAYEDLRWDERREEERHEEEQRLQQEQYHSAQRQAEQQEEQEYWANRNQEE